MILTTQAARRALKLQAGLQFQCATCGEVKDVHTSGGTGYGYDDDNRPICYACCSVADRARMIETGRACLYLTTSKQKTCGVIFRTEDSPHKVSNWPGTLTFRANVRKGRHNIAGTRYDVWFTGPDGKQWHGVTYGENTQICHCRRTKG